MEQALSILKDLLARLPEIRQALGEARWPEFARELAAKAALFEDVTDEQSLMAAVDELYAFFDIYTIPYEALEIYRPDTVRGVGSHVSFLSGIGTTVQAVTGRFLRLCRDPLTQVQLRLDVALPTEVEVGRAFMIAVAVQQPDAPVLARDDLPRTETGDLDVMWPASASSVKLCVQISAPDCDLHGKDSETLTLHADQNSRVFHFQLTPRTTGTLNIVVRVYQAEDWLRDAVVHTVAYERETGKVSATVPSVVSAYPLGDCASGLPAELYGHLVRALLECGPFDSNASVRDIFVDERIAPWRYGLPQADSIEGRVYRVIGFLHNQYRDTQENALVLLLQVLCDQYVARQTWCHQWLVNLADELAKTVRSLCYT